MSLNCFPHDSVFVIVFHNNLNVDSVFAISEVPEVKISFILDITKTSSNKFCLSACIISTLFTTHSSGTDSDNLWEGGQTLTPSQWVTHMAGNCTI